MTVAELINRLEAATGPDRTLDADIALAVGLVRREFDDDRSVCLFHGPHGYLGTDEGWKWPDMPAFTASLDAALTLVPEGREVDLHVYADGSAYVSVFAGGDDAVDGVGGDSPAIAVCLAALLARSDR